MTWKHVVAILIVTAGFFFTAWQAPTILILAIGFCVWFITRVEDE